MVTSVVDPRESNTLIKDENIIYWLEKRFIYGTSQILEVGTETDFFLTPKEEYELFFNDMPSGKYTLHKTYSKELEKVPFTVYVFMSKENSDILNNLVPNEREIFSIPLKNYIRERNNQLSYIIQNIRKKGLLLTVNNDTKKTEQYHVQENINNEPVELNLTDFYITEYEDDIVAKRYNYYTIIANNKYPRTTKGKGIPKYIPFATQEEINGLNTYLVAKYELKTDISALTTGDNIVLENENAVIMEMEFFGFNGVFTTNYIAGVI